MAEAKSPIGESCAEARVDTLLEHKRLEISLGHNVGFDTVNPQQIVFHLLGIDHKPVIGIVSFVIAEVFIFCLLWSPISSDYIIPFGGGTRVGLIGL